MAEKIIPLAKVRIDGGTQPRASINSDLVAEYAERMKAGDEFPPVDIFFDGADYWLAEGFHRYHAASRAGEKTISYHVHKGTQRDAILFSCGANHAHGLRRTNADKRKAVETLLGDEEWSQNSDRWIADICGVGHQLVADARRQLDESSSSNGDDETKRKGRDGKSRKPPKQKAKPDEEPDDSPDDPTDISEPKPAEPNELGELGLSIDTCYRLWTDGKPPHFKVFVDERLRRLMDG